MQFKGCSLSDGLIFPSIKLKYDNISSWDLPEYTMSCSGSKFQIPVGAGQIFSLFFDSNWISPQKLDI